MNGQTNSYSDIIIRLYGRLIFWGRKTLADVPETYRDQVKTWCDAHREEYIG